MVISFPKKNNLELLRLIFAAQVLLVHASVHLGYTIPEVVRHFPGVPAFFFVSGFLIYASYLNSPGRRYFENRFFRLFPGLLFVTIGGAAVAIFARGWSDLSDNLGIYMVWLLGQVTLAQSYNPQIFREVGVGVINGSLWTITTEILFYLAVPVIVWMERQFRFTVILLLALSFFIYAIGPQYLTERIFREKNIYDAVALTPVVWGWMFAFGILAAKNFERLRSWLKYMPFSIVPMILMAYIGEGAFFASSGNRLGIVYFACYVGLLMWLAFATPTFRLTFDLSYGIYIWHMPVINLLLVLAFPSMWLAILLTFIVSVCSWAYVEKPALKLKKNSLRPIQS